MKKSVIARFSEMTEEQKKRYDEFYKSVLLTGIGGTKVVEPTKDFDEYGLRFTTEYLSYIGKNVIFFPLELMAEYVDIITKTAIDKNDKEFIFNQLIDPDFNIEEQYENLNATAIGNLGYICLNCKDEKAKELTENILNEIFVKAKGILLAAMNEEL
jgi:hypothetical protein